MKRPIKFTEQGVHWLLAASRFQPGKNAGSLAVGPPRLAGTRGQHMRWWARPQQLGQGAISDPAAQFEGSSRPLLSALHTPLPGCHPSAPLGPSCKAKCGLGGSCGRRAGPCPRQRPGHSQAQLSHQPSQPSSLHCLWGRQLAQAPAYPLLRCPMALTLQDLPPGPLDGKSVSRGACVSYGIEGPLRPVSG